MSSSTVALLIVAMAASSAAMDGFGNAMDGWSADVPYANAAVGVASDVKYIKCEVCQHFVEAAHAAVAAKRKTAGASLSEDDVSGIIAKSCKANTREGAWMRSIDLEESSDGGSLRLVKQKGEGPCEAECMTIALACEAIAEGMENELSESLWEGSSTPQATSEKACRTWSPACKKAAPKLEAGRPRGPAFRPYTDEEVALRAHRDHRGMTPPGVLGVAAFQAALDVKPAAGSAASPMAGDSSSVEGQGGGAEEGRQSGLGDAAGGAAGGALHQAAAFEEL